jgi:serine protease
MATPHVSGVVALMRAEAPGMTPAQLDALLDGSSAYSPICEDLGAPGRDDLFGHGLIDARLAVQAAIELAGGGAGSDDARLVVTPTSLSFPARTTSRVLTLSRGGQGPLSLEAAVVSSEAWLEVAAQNVDGDGLGSYVVSLDAAAFAALPDGTHAATITLDSTSNTVLVQALAQKGGEQYPNTGYQFLLLLDPDDLETAASVAIPISEGEYPYRIDDVKRGEYVVVIGTDLDNDGFICDEGEACGAFPQLDEPARVKVRGTRTGIDFSTGYSANLQTTGSGRRGPGGRDGFRIRPVQSEPDAYPAR